MSKILIVQGKDVPELSRLKDELLRRDYQVDAWYPRDLTPEQFVDGTLANFFGLYDLIYYRTGLTDAGVMMLPRLFNDQAHRFVNQNLFHQPLCNNKTYQAVAALEVGLKIPFAYIGKNVSFEQLTESLGLPFIAKLPTGVRGHGVFKIDNRVEFEDCFKNLEDGVVWQKFIPNDGDYRVFVIGNKVHAIYKRVPRPGNFKNNISQGGHGEVVDDENLQAELARTGLAIARQLKVDIAGVDVIRSLEDGALYFTEININPGWLGLDKTLGVNTAAVIADYFSTRIKSSTTRSL